MLSEEITIRVDPEAARIYRSASDEDRLKLDLLLSLRLTWYAQPRPSLETIMSDISAEARRNGMTPEILESILNEP